MLVPSGTSRHTTRYMFSVSSCTARYGRYIPIQQDTNTRTAHYRAVSKPESPNAGTRQRLVSPRETRQRLVFSRGMRGRLVSPHWTR
ncbi:hypothetical protein BHM03_00031873 [Ensete ventricosum]|nr:hypothetical protein BHM03_00031873 [Ensete ventricosum]